MPTLDIRGLAFSIRGLATHKYVAPGSYMRGRAKMPILGANAYIRERPYMLTGHPFRGCAWAYVNAQYAYAWTRLDERGCPPWTLWVRASCETTLPVHARVHVDEYARCCRLHNASPCAPIVLTPDFTL